MHIVYNQNSQPQTQKTALPRSAIIAEISNKGLEKSTFQKNSFLILADSVFLKVHLSQLS